jgi:hypothetical protein
MAVETTPEVYQIHAWIQHVSPMIWRRVLVRTDSTVVNLHDVLQIAFGWSDFHLHRFHIHGRDYGVNEDVPLAVEKGGGSAVPPFSRKVKLGSRRLPTNLSVRPNRAGRVCSPGSRIGCDEAPGEST